jgi:hypothetical protein
VSALALRNSSIAESLVTSGPEKNYNQNHFIINMVAAVNLWKHIKLLSVSLVCEPRFHQLKMTQYKMATKVG